jgi:hypothetical protein
MRDFTTRIYRNLIIELIRAGYTFQTFQEFLVKPAKRVIIIRHDIDTRKKNSLHFAYIEHALDLPTTYYFRILPKSFDPVVLSLIKNLGHEIGYHYEDLTLANGDMQKAIALFEEHLSALRQHYPVKTICMHGSPMSKYDNRDLWKKYRYRDYGIIGEPYFDIDFNNVLYLTDTGRTWNNNGISVRDKVKRAHNLRIRSTREMIRKIPEFPDKVMLTFHPQRWTDSFFPWALELVIQNIKNIFKRYFLVKNR